jgi:hypothetical protein
MYLNELHPTMERDVSNFLGANRAIRCSRQPIA